MTNEIKRKGNQKHERNVRRLPGTQQPGRRNGNEKNRKNHPCRLIDRPGPKYRKNQGSNTN